MAAGSGWLGKGLIQAESAETTTVKEYSVSVADEETNGGRRGRNGVGKVAESYQITAPDHCPQSRERLRSMYYCSYCYWLADYLLEHLLAHLLERGTVESVARLLLLNPNVCFRGPQYSTVQYSTHSL